MICLTFTMTLSGFYFDVVAWKISSVLWHCSLGDSKRIRPGKNRASNCQTFFFGRPAEDLA